MSGVALRITASSLERIQACPASMALPSILRSSEAAARGTAIHKYAERLMLGMPESEALPLVPPEWRDTCAGFDPGPACGDLRRGSVQLEASYGWNVASNVATFLGSGLGRGYPPPHPGDIFGTTDVAGVRAWDGRGVIVDWKSGAGNVTHPRDNLQLKFAALAFSALHQLSEVEVRLGLVRNSGDVDVERHVFRSFALDDIRDELAELYARAARLVEDGSRGDALLPVLQPGAHCQYCPALPCCPAKVALARALLPELATVRDKLEGMTSEQRGQAFLKYREAKQLMEVLHEAFNSLARAEPIPVDESREVRELVYLKRSFDRKAAVALLREKGATDEELARLEPQVQTSRIDVFKKPGAPRLARRPRTVTE